MESWLSGLKRTIGNRVSVMSASGVQIPNSPPSTKACRMADEAVLWAFYYVQIHRVTPQNTPKRF